MSKKETLFQKEEFCVYKTHGVGQIREIQTIQIGNFESECYIVFFEKARLTVSVPTTQAHNDCLRKISSMGELETSLEILRNGIQKSKGMWSRRAKEYEEKINSGSITLIAEVLRDLTRDIEEADRSYSERIIYETALYRLASEAAIVYGIKFEEAKEKILEISKEKIKFADISEVVQVVAGEA